MKLVRTNRSVSGLSTVTLTATAWVASDETSLSAITSPIPPLPSSEREASEGSGSSHELARDVERRLLLPVTITTAEAGLIATAVSFLLYGTEGKGAGDRRAGGGRHCGYSAGGTPAW